MAIPVLRSVGAVGSGAAGFSPGMPAGWQADDIFVMAVCTANQLPPATWPPTGWSLAPTQPTGFGTAGAAAAVGLFVLWRRAVGGDGAPSITDSGSMQIARIAAFSGCVTSGDPWDVTATSNQTTANTAVSFDSLTTSVADTLICHILGGDRDIASTTDMSALTNGNLTSLTPDAGLFENWVIAGNGGGIYLGTGGKAAAGSTGATTATITSQVYSKWTGALKGATSTTYTKLLQVTSTGTPAFVKALAYGITATVSSTGTSSLAKASTFVRLLAASSTAVPALARTIARSFVVSGTAVASRVLTVKKTLAASAAGTASFVKALAYGILAQATAAGTASVTRVRTSVRLLAAAGTGAVTLTDAVTLYMTRAASGSATTTLQRTIKFTRSVLGAAVATTRRTVGLRLGAAGAGGVSLGDAVQMSKSLSVSASAFLAASRTFIGGGPVQAARALVRLVTARLFPRTTIRTTT